MSEDLLASPVSFAVVVAALWVVTLYLISALGGWSALAAEYSADGDFEGEKRHFQSLNVERISLLPAGYASIITIGSNSNGVYLSVFSLFRLFHSPLFIPFSDLQGQEGKGFLFRALRSIRLRTKKAPEIAVVINPEQARWLESHSNGAWRYARIKEG